jgi:hypothetical protein
MMPALLSRTAQGVFAITIQLPFAHVVVLIAIVVHTHI